MARKSPGAVLKSKGLIPSSWNLKKLSSGQKSWVTKQTKTFSEVLKKPAEFSTVSAKTRTQKQQARIAGFKVSGDRAIIRVGQGGRVRRSGERLIITTPTRRKDIFFASGKNFQKRLDLAMKRKLAPNQVWAVQVGDSPVSHTHYRELAHLLHYLEVKDDWHTDTGEADEELQRHIALVLITESGSHYIEKLSQGSENVKHKPRSTKTQKRKGNKK